MCGWVRGCVGGLWGGGGWVGNGGNACKKGVSGRRGGGATLGKQPLQPTSAAGDGEALGFAVKDNN